MHERVGSGHMLDYMCSHLIGSLLFVYVQGSLHCKQHLFVSQLYYRSVDIISELSGAGEEAAGTALLRAIYRDDDAEKVRSWNCKMFFWNRRKYAVPLRIQVVGTRLASSFLSSIYTFQSVFPGLPCLSFF